LDTHFQALVFEELGDIMSLREGKRVGRVARTVRRFQSIEVLVWMAVQTRTFFA